jgi:signal transduction histidine kinase
MGTAFSGTKFTTGLGLSIVKERIELFNQELKQKISIRIDEKLRYYDRGFRVTIMI